MPSTPPKLETGDITVKAELEVEVETMEVKEEHITPRRSRRGGDKPEPAATTPPSSRKRTNAKSAASTPAKNGVRAEHEEKDEIDPDWRNTHLYASTPVDRVQAHMNSAKGDGKALHRGAWQHGKSCSAAYWDPWGRRVLTTSYDDKLRGMSPFLIPL
jgi:ABC-type uncharacterized transport system involved in gliding motility auxiliary subunit